MSTDHQMQKSDGREENGYIYIYANTAIEANIKAMIIPLSDFRAQSFRFQVIFSRRVYNNIMQATFLFEIR